MSQQQPTTLTASSGTSASLPTFGMSLGSYQPSALALSIVELLNMTRLYNEMKAYQTEQMMLELDAQQQAALGAAEFQRKAGKEQRNASLSQGIATIVGGGLQSASGFVELQTARGGDGAIEHAKTFKTAAADRIQSGTNVQLTELSSRPAPQGYGAGELRMQGGATDYRAPVAEQGLDQAQSARIGKRLQEMKDGSFDFGKQSIQEGEKVALKNQGHQQELSEAEAAIRTSTVEEARTIQQNVDDFIKNKAKELARGNPWTQVLRGAGEVSRGIGQIPTAIFEQRKANAEADNALAANAQQNAQKMVDTAGQQFNAEDQAQTGLYQMIAQMMQSAVYQA